MSGRVKRSQPDTDTMRRTAESNYMISNWPDKGSKKLEQLVSKSNKSTLSRDEKFLRKYLEELGDEYKSRKLKNLASKRSSKKKEIAAVRRSAGPQIASADKHLELAKAETYQRKRVSLHTAMHYLKYCESFVTVFSNVTIF
jgi:hypothetical protein